jgi:broad-specificity NMP kinase
MRNTIIIVEGPQGTGKTTVTNYLREKMSATDLYRLSGIKDRTETGKEKIRIKYEKLLEYVESCQDINMVFDRNFFSNEVYARLGYQEYSFTDVYEKLLKKLDNMDADIYLVILYLKDENEFANRLKRDKHEYQKFEVESSIRQQNEYLKLADEVEKEAKNIKVIRFSTDNDGKFEEKMEEHFGKLFD